MNKLFQSRSDVRSRTLRMIHSARTHRAEFNSMMAAHKAARALLPAGPAPAVELHWRKGVKA